MPGISPYPNQTTSSSSGTIKTGLASISANGINDTFTIAHGLGTLPAYACISPKNAVASGLFTLNWDATNLTIQFMVAPTAGILSIGWVVTS